MDFPADARLLVIDGLHPMEWSVLGVENARQVWTGGPIDPQTPAEGLDALAQVLRGAPRPALLTLPMGDRSSESLGELFARRARLLRDALSAAREHPGPLWVTSTWGSVYLGHGLRQDVGEGLDGQADAARAEASRVFGLRRLVLEPSPPLRAAIPRPSLVAAGRRLVVGRLSWPDPPGTPWLHAGGLCLPERLLPIFIL